MPRLALTAVLLLGWAGQAAAVEPVYWRQRVFFIPYQAPAPERFASPIDKVQLMVSRDGIGDWTVLQEAQPTVRGFSYHAPVDGEYAFSLRTADRKGKLTPPVVGQPQLRVVVDTVAPTLQMTATVDATGRIMARYEARDVALKPETLRLEAQVGGGPWERLASGPPDVNQPDRFVGQFVWKPPTAAGEVHFRGTIDDRAGNQGTAATQTSLVNPMPTLAAGPLLTNPSGGSAPPPSFAISDSPSAPKSSLEWSAAQPAAPVKEGPRLEDPFAAAAPLLPMNPPRIPQERIPAQPIADGGPASRPTAAATSLANPFAPPPLFDNPPAALAPSPVPLTGMAPQELASQPAPAVPNQQWSAAPAGDAAPGSLRWVNSLTFDVDYDLQTVGPWGVSKVEMWATRDGGRQWVNFCTDQDNRSPLRVTVPAAGVYGFRMVVSGANGAAAPTPVAGDQPELVIGVDLQEPQVALQAAEVGQGTLADHLIVRWTASDENLEARPVGLFYSAEADGPWSTIATDLDNSGQYAWRLLRQVPEKLFLRLEVRDKAGNVTVRQSPAPVVLHVPQPTGRLRSVRPVGEDPSRYRTAAGAGHTPAAQ